MEAEFKNEDIVIRRKLLMKLMGFIRKIKNNYETLLAYDVVKIYYDNGQVELSRILASVFNVLLPSVETKKVVPSDYRLFQVADFICTMKLTELKISNHSMSVQEQRFFGGEIGAIKNSIKDLRKSELN